MKQQDRGGIASHCVRLDPDVYDIARRNQLPAAAIIGICRMRRAVFVCHKTPSYTCSAMRAIERSI